MLGQGRPPSPRRPTLLPRRSSPPPVDCLRRFLGPIEQLAGSHPRTAEPSKADDAKPREAKGESQKDGDSKPRDAKGERPPKGDDWIDVATQSVSDLRSTLGAGASIDVMIATIPDPVDSGLDYLFDTTLQALRLGLEHGGKEPIVLRFDLTPREDDASPEYAPLYRDRSWLPWRDADASGTARIESMECRATTPGVMLFRDSAAKSRRLRLLFLVGESPTRGVHVSAMVNALALAHAIAPCTGPLERDAQTKPPSCATRIIAPTFSGGAFSLRLAFDKWVKDARIGPAAPVPFHIVTGSATGSGLPQALGADAGWSDSLRVWFEATTAPESAVECAYLHLLRRLGAATDPSQLPNVAVKLLPEVATLHESGTEFGATADSADARCGLRPGVQISFPVHIASLRDAYEELDRKEAAKEKDAIARPTSLDVSLHEKHTALDAQANPSPKTTYAQDVALANVLTQISVEKVRHVGIHATDVADAIFLARKIRDVAPDVRLAFFEADSLLLHPAYQRDLRGSLVVSPYVFLGASPFGAPALEGLRAYAPFENAAAEGTFNAVLATRGWRFDRLLEYALPSSSVALPIWLSSIGRNGIVPLGVVRPVDCAGTIYRGGASITTDSALVAVRGPARARSWRFDKVRTLDLRSDVPLPRGICFSHSGAGFVIDQRMIWKTGHTLAKDPIPAEISEAADLRGSRHRSDQVAHSTRPFARFSLRRVSVSARRSLCWLATTTERARRRPANQGDDASPSRPRSG